MTSSGESVLPKQRKLAPYSKYSNYQHSLNVQYDILLYGLPSNA